MEVPATSRSSDAACAVSARVATSAPPTRATVSPSRDTEPARARGCASLVCPNVVIAGIGRSVGSGSSSASASGP
jgi:hypothetical protein